MEANRNTKPSAEATPEVVTAPTLKQAYKLVRERYGRNAVILGSRNIVRRQALGLGREKLVEVTVHPMGSKLAPAAGLGAPAAARARSWQEGTDELAVEIAREVERIETLVEEIAARRADDRPDYRYLREIPLARTLLEGGAGETTVDTLLKRFAGETAKDPTDRAAVLAWLADNLRASNCRWDGFFGCHAFLGRAGSGRTSLVLASAARLKAQGRRTLVLSVLPSNSGAVRHLQIAAAQHGFDAAIIEKPERLPRSEAQLADYDAVLVDLPASDHPALRIGGTLHAWLAPNASFHRHLLVPLDLDTREYVDLDQQARQWNCDWVAVTAVDRTRFRARLLDLSETVPLPVSLLTSGPRSPEPVAIATSDALLDLALGAEPAGAMKNDAAAGGD